MIVAEPVPVPRVIVSCSLVSVALTRVGLLLETIEYLRKSSRLVVVMLVITMYLEESVGKSGTVPPLSGTSFNNKLGLFLAKLVLAVTEPEPEAGRPAVGGG